MPHASWSAAELARLQAKNIAPRARTPPDGTDVAPPPQRGTSTPAAMRTASAAPPPPRAGYGTVAVEGFKGQRFVCVAASAELVEALAAVCAAHGARPLATGHFIVESSPGSGPKIKVKSKE